MTFLVNHLDFSAPFVQIPNAWMRDGRMSHRARGILAELMTHSSGWQVHMDSLIENGSEGRDAVRSAVKELVHYGYLRQVRVKDPGTGKLAGSQYVTTVPSDTHEALPYPDGRPRDHRETGFQAAGFPVAQESPPKKNNPKKTKTSSLTGTDGMIPGMTMKIEGTGALDLDGFDEFWAVYPKKLSKPDARRAFSAARGRGVSVAKLVAKAEVYAQYHEAKKTEERFVKYPGKWLDDEKYEDVLRVTAVPSTDNPW